jgi:outer membrane protein TolC
MAEENAAIGVAIGGYYPDFTLSGAFGYSGDPFMKALAGANPVWSYGLELAQPLFNGGLTDAQVEAARRTYDSSVATYRQTVLTALQQVEDQLSAVPTLTRELAVQTEAVKAANQAVQIALNEYSAGTQNFTTVVTAEATALVDQQSALSTRAQRLTDVITLIVALGGGWTTADLPDPNPNP